MENIVFQLYMYDAIMSTLIRISKKDSQIKGYNHKYGILNKASTISHVECA